MSLDRTQVRSQSSYIFLGKTIADSYRDFKNDSETGNDPLEKSQFCLEKESSPNQESSITSQGGPQGASKLANSVSSIDTGICSLVPSSGKLRLRDLRGNMDGAAFFNISINFRHQGLNPRLVNRVKLRGSDPDCKLALPRVFGKGRAWV